MKKAWVFSSVLPVLFAFAYFSGPKTVQADPAAEGEKKPITLKLSAQ